MEVSFPSVLRVGLSVAACTGCLLAAPNAQAPSSLKAQLSVSDPAAIKYLGDGVNVFAKTAFDAVRKTGVDISSASRTVGAQSYTSSCGVVSNSTDITTSLEYHHESSGGLTLEKITLSPSLKIDLTAKYHLTTKTVSMFASMEYEYATVIADQVSLKPSVLTDPLCMTTINGTKVFSPALFKQVYGDGFVSKARLGERLYIVYEAQITDTSISSKAEVKAAMEAKVLELLSGKTSSSIIAAADIVLNKTQRSGHIYATGGFINTSFLQDETAIAKAYTDFGTYVQNKVNNAGSAEFSIIEKQLTPYAPYMSSSISVDESLNKLIKWQELYGKIETVEINSTDYATIQQCNLAMEAIAPEIQKCRDNASTARYPGVGDYPGLVNAWENFITGPLTRAHVAGKGWLGWVDETQVAGTVGESRRAEAIQINLPADKDPNWHITYRAHAGGIGWMGWVQDGQTAGTTGQSRQMEAFTVLLKGMPSKYHVRYRAHVAGLGWMGWVSDGAVAGTTGQSRRLEAVQVQVISEATALKMSINGSSASSQTLASGAKMLLSGSCEYTDSFFVSVQESDAYWNGIGTEVTEWVTYDKCLQIKNGTFNVDAFCASHGFQMGAGKYYRVAIAVGNPWIKNTVLVYKK